MDLSAVSAKLDKIELKFTFDNTLVQVLWFRVMERKGKWLIGRHSHSSFEFHFVAAGACRVRLDNGSFVAHSGEFYLTSPRVFHEQSFSGEEGYTEYSINVDFTDNADETEGNALLTAFRYADCRAVPDRYQGVRSFFEALEEVSEQKLGYFNRIRILAAELLIGAARSLSDAQGSVRKYEIPLKATGNDQRFAEIKRFVEDNISSRLDESDLCNHIYLSGRQICRIIRQFTGKSTHQYISFIRLQRAKTLLRESNFSLSEIASMLGFTSEYYFNQFFKREEGYPPGVYRKNVRNP